MNANAERKILVVEDDAEIREFLTVFLAGRGYRVQAARDGFAGLDAVDEFVPDLVLLNVTMPRLHGFGMMDALRERKLDKRPRVVMTTASETNTLQRAHWAGAIDLLYYPVSEHALLQIINEVLDPAVDEWTLRELARIRHALRVFDCVGCGAALILLQQIAMSTLQTFEQRKSLRAALRWAARQRLAHEPLTRELVQERASKMRVVDPALVALALAESI